MSTHDTPIPNTSSPKPRAPVVTEVTTQNIPLRRPAPTPGPLSDTPTPPVSPTITDTPVQRVTKDVSLPQLGQPAPVPVDAVAKTYSEENPDFTPIELLSGFQFYPFKTMSARTLKGSHQAKLNKAYTQNRLRFLVEAISATLEPSVSAFDLTPADFYFLMYWQKVNSFTKSPQIITAPCTDEGHLAKVKSKELPEESLKIDQFLNATTLESKYADKLDLLELAAALPSYDLGVETMRDVVTMTERMIDIAEDEDSEEDIEEYGWLASRASFLRTPVSFEDRCKVVADMSAEDVTALDKYMTAVTNYGVEEFATIKCKECGASKRVKISFDALSFL